MIFYFIHIRTIIDNLKLLNEAAPYIRSEVGKRMRLRSVPYIKFHYDTSFENGMRVSELLAQFPAVSDAEEDED